jgi:hypothetical protein
MTTIAMYDDSANKDSASTASKDGPAPSGFILKLYQMVNGAPDDLVSVRFFRSGHLFFKTFFATFSIALSGFQDFLKSFFFFLDDQ